MSPKRP